MVDVQTISIATASSGVFLAAIYYILQLRHQNKVRQTDLVMRLYSQFFGSEDHQRAGKKVLWITYKDYDDFAKKYGAPNSEEPIPMAIDKVLYSFEELGVLLSKKLVDIDLIDQLMGYNIIMIGTKVMPIIEEARKRLNLPRVWTNFEYLYNEMKKREQKLKKSKV
jgi:hypothetical protein